jgi:hypothetical protein
MVHVAAKFGTGWNMDDDLYFKVLGIVVNSRSPRLVAAATVFHVWLLKGRPNRRTWEYRKRVLYATDVLRRFEALGAELLHDAVPNDLPAAYRN